MICAICREKNCGFETRCGHFFHEECLLTAVFSDDNTIGPCPYCRCEISSIKILEKLIEVVENFYDNKMPTINFINECEDIIKDTTDIK